MSAKIHDLEESLELLSASGPSERPSISGPPHPQRPENSSSPSSSASASRVPSASASAAQSASASALAPGQWQRRDSSDSDARLPAVRDSLRASRSAPLHSTLQPSGACSCALVVHDFLGDLSREFDTLSKLCSFPSTFLQGYTQLTASKPGFVSCLLFTRNYAFLP